MSCGNLIGGIWNVCASTALPANASSSAGVATDRLLGPPIVSLHASFQTKITAFAECAYPGSTTLNRLGGCTPRAPSATATEGGKQRERATRGSVRREPQAKREPGLQMWMARSSLIDEIAPRVSLVGK